MPKSFTNHIEELSVGDRRFRFQLCRKPETMGPVPVDHWWMNTKNLYGQRGHTSRNHATVIGYHWALSEREGESGDPEAQESFILAHILPQWGRPNSRVTRGHLGQSSDIRAFMSSSNRPYGFTCSQISGVNALKSRGSSFCLQSGCASTCWSMRVLT
jgi:hypothetical protein